MTIDGKEILSYQKAIDLSSIVSITDKEGKIIYVNDLFCSITKYTRQELIGETHKLVNSSYHPSVFFNNMWQTIAQGKIWRGEVKNKTKDGDIYWVDSIISPIVNDKGEIEKYIAIQDVITERKKQEQTVHALFSLTKEPGGDKFFSNLTNTLCNILDVKYALIGKYLPDTKTIETLGFSKYGQQQEGFSYSVESTPCENVINQEPCVFSEGVKEHFPNDPYLVELQIESYIGVTLHKNEEPVGLIVVMDGKPMQQISFKEDILYSIIKRTETELERAEQQSRLKIINQELISAEDDEKARIAYELHDGLGQTLAAAKMRLSVAESKKDIENIEKLIQQAITETRAVLNNLAPKKLYDFGLYRAVLDLIEETKKIKKIIIELNYPNKLIQTTISDHVKFNIYRIIQESINNTLKHTSATEIKIDFKLTGKTLKILYQNNGQKIDAKILNKPSTFMSIKRRVNILTGEFKVRSNKNNNVQFRYIVCLT